MRFAPHYCEVPHRFGHLEQIQWRVRPVALVPGTAAILNPELAVDYSQFTMNELLKGIRKSSCGETAKPDDVPVECLKAMAQEGELHLEWLLDFCNECWTARLHLSRGEPHSPLYFIRKATPPAATIIDLCACYPQQCWSRRCTVALAIRF